MVRIRVIAVFDELKDSQTRIIDQLFAKQRQQARARTKWLLDGFHTHFRFEAFVTMRTIGYHPSLAGGPMSLERSGPMTRWTVFDVEIERKILPAEVGWPYEHQIQRDGRL